MAPDVSVGQEDAQAQAQWSRVSLTHLCSEVGTTDPGVGALPCRPQVPGGAAEGVTAGLCSGEREPESGPWGEAGHGDAPLRGAGTLTCWARRAPGAGTPRWRWRACRCHPAPASRPTAAAGWSGRSARSPPSSPWLCGREVGERGHRVSELAFPPATARTERSRRGDAGATRAGRGAAAHRPAAQLRGRADGLRVPSPGHGTATRSRGKAACPACSVGVTVPCRGHGHCLETFLVVSAGERALSPGGQRPGTQLNVPQGPGQPPPRRLIQPQGTTVPAQTPGLGSPLGSPLRRCVTSGE